MLNSPVDRFRRFSRIVTVEVGALDASFLDRGRTLGAARVINAVGQGASDIKTIRDRLGLDSGLMSRLLRSLEREGLIAIRINPEDARRRVATLTAAGRREHDAYDALSNARAENLLARHPEPERLLEAMDQVASALGRDRITLVEIDPRAEEACDCLNAYYSELASRIEGGFEVSRSLDPEAAAMTPPRGVFIVAMSEGQPVGCVGLKGSASDIAEIKRLWVASSARGLGLAKRLMDAAEQAARRLSVRTLRLDTNRALVEAIRFYRAAGWTEIERFNDESYADFFFEKQL